MSAKTFFKQSSVIAAVILKIMVGTVVLTACSKAPVDNSEAHAETADADFERGPHNGRLLRNGNFALEITLFEKNVAPEFRVYATQKNKPIDPAAIALRIQLQRFAGIVDNHAFTAQENYLVSTAEVYEPHSFDVTVDAEYQGRAHRWKYASYEGRTTIAAAIAQNQGVEIARVDAGHIEETIALYGAIKPDATRQRSVIARFPGVIRSVDVALGESVRAGQLLARIESNESLQTYAVTAPIAGTVIQRHANAGEAAATEALFEIADYSQVWAELTIFPRDRARLHIGQAVIVRAADGSASGQGTIAAITADAPTPSTLNTRVVLDNVEQKWTPGQFINANVSVAKIATPIGVPISALQTFRDWDVVFLNAGDVYQAQPVTLGRRDNSHVEILGGLHAGMSVVTTNSYLIKADIEKSGASHDH